MGDTIPDVLTLADELIPGWCLAVATIVGEAGGEPYKGQLAVAKVIRNRMKYGYNSPERDSVVDTVLAPLQFSLWNSGDKGRRRVCKLRLSDPAVQTAMRAWRESGEPEAWQSQLPASFDNAVLYHATQRILTRLGLRVPRWAARAKYLTRIGQHLFYADPAVTARVALNTE